MNGREAAQAVGITYRQLDHWVSQGWVPGGNPGSGKRRDIDAEGLTRLGALAALVHIGFRPEAAVRLLEVSTTP